MWGWEQPRLVTFSVGSFMDKLFILISHLQDIIFWNNPKIPFIYYWLYIGCYQDYAYKYNSYGFSFTWCLTPPPPIPQCQFSHPIITHSIWICRHYPHPNTHSKELPFTNQKIERLNQTITSSYQSKQRQNNSGMAYRD